MTKSLGLLISQSLRRQIHIMRCSFVITMPGRLNFSEMVTGLLSFRNFFFKWRTTLDLNSWLILTKKTSNYKGIVRYIYIYIHLYSNITVRQGKHGTLIKFYQRWIWVGKAICMWWEAEEKRVWNKGKHSAKRNNTTWYIEELKEV